MVGMCSEGLKKGLVLVMEGGISANGILEVKFVVLRFEQMLVIWENKELDNSQIFWLDFWEG